MKNEFYFMMLCVPALVGMEPTPNTQNQEQSVEEFPTVAINFTIHNNHHIKQDNSNSSSSEQSVNKDDKKEANELIPGPLLRFMRIISDITFR